jgi:hypothetical protein
MPIGLTRAAQCEPRFSTNTISTVNIDSYSGDRRKVRVRQNYVKSCRRAVIQYIKEFFVTTLKTQQRKDRAVW